MLRIRFILITLFIGTRQSDGGALKLTGLNFANSTITAGKNSTFVKSTTLSNETNNALHKIDPPINPPKEIRKDLSTKSEIYKMHNNGLMLLHPQRSGNGLGIKKSELTSHEDNSDDIVNYHVWKKVDKNNETSSIAEHEQLLEAKLGNLPQISEGKRETIAFPKGENKKTIICYGNDPKCNKNTLDRKVRSSDDPLFDDDQPEEILRRYKEKSQIQKMKTRYGQAFGRNIPDILPIKPIPNIANKFDKIEPLEQAPRFPYFGPALSNYPRFGVPDLELLNYPRFPAPKMDEFEQVPGIPHIRPLSRGDEVTGDKRGYPVKNDEFYDRELDEDVEHYSPITSPTSIPFLTNIPDIQDIQDIPTLSPAAASRRSSEGVNGKMPVIDTINTKDGKETRVST